MMLRQTLTRTRLIPRSAAAASATVPRRCQSSFLAPTPIEKIILDDIQSKGPVPFATYINLCLSHPVHGYYTSPQNPIFGKKGDFITSPEISQVFGELVAVWLLSRWMTVPRPKFRIVELGPGRGTLMADILRVFKQFPTTRDSLARVHLVETSRPLRQQQEKSLSGVSAEIAWHESIEEVPVEEDDMYTMFIAHEFFDALPVHVFEKRPEGWRELMVGSSPPPESPLPQYVSTYAPSSPMPSTTTNRLRTVLSKEATGASSFLPKTSPRFEVLPRVEISPASFKIARRAAELFKNGGAGLVIDYGADHAFGDSLRAFKSHKIVDTFHRPGECDLTANVDFAYLKEAMAGLVNTHGTLSQRAFLKRMGIDARVQAIGSQTVSEAAKRLVDLTGMGGQYRFLGITANKENSASSGSSDKKGTTDEEVWPFIEGLKDEEESDRKVR